MTLPGDIRSLPGAGAIATARPGAQARGHVFLDDWAGLPLWIFVVVGLPGPAAWNIPEEIAV
jgi:hypothetical protein